MIHLMISSNIKWAVSQRRLLQVKYLGGIQGPLALRRLALRHFFVLLHIPRHNTIWPKHLSTRIFRLCRGDTVQYHGGLQSRELGQATVLLLSLTPRQVSSSHPCQQMVWLYWLQDRDSMPNWYTINHSTILHTQWNTVTHCCLPMALCNVGCIPQAKVPSLDT